MGELSDFAVGVPPIFASPKSSTFTDAVGLDLDVAGFQIAMRDALLVRGFERVGDLFGNGQRFIEGNRALFDALRQRLTLHQFHHQVVGADVVERADVGVIQGSDRAGFRLEALAEAFRRNFDGDIAAKARVVGAIHLAHPARADGREDLVRAEFVAGGKRHRRDSAKCSE